MTGAEVGKEEHCLTTSYKEEMGSGVNVSRVAKILILISDLTSALHEWSCRHLLACVHPLKSCGPGSTVVALTPCSAQHHRITKANS
jgi:hypothetical protein